MTTGERVRALRELLGLTQEELARKLGYKDKSTIGHIEQGRDIPRKTIIQLAEALGTTPQYLMGWDNTAKTPAVLRSEIIKAIKDLPDSEIEKIAKQLKIK